MPEPGVIVVAVGAGVDEPPPWVAATTPPATAAPATANIMSTLADIPIPAAAPAAAPATALVWLMVTLATRPCEDAVTRICKFPCTLFGWKPWATARPWESLMTVKVREPLAKTPLAP